MSIGPATYENLAMPLVEQGEDLSGELLSLIRRSAETLAEAPEEEPRIRDRVEQQIEEKVQDFQANANSWPDEELAAAYQRGFESANGDLEAAVDNPRDEGNDITAGQVMTAGMAATVSQQAQRTEDGVVIPPSLLARLRPKGRKFFSENPQHYNFYATFRQAARDDIEGMMRPIIRETRDMYRDVAIQSGTQRFRAESVTRRRDMSQDMVRRFANRGITGVMYRDGRRMPVEEYSEMVGRTMSGRCSVQAELNRLHERGYDLIRMSVHAGASPLCEPWQGGVYSQTGQSDRYPPWADAVAGGAFHPQCIHHISPYIPGRSPSRSDIERRHPAEAAMIREHGEARGNRMIYEATQEQRRIERGIRKWKRRQSTAMTDREARRAQNKIREWQGRQRQHTEQFRFLRRKYEREQI